MENLLTTLGVMEVAFDLRALTVGPRRSLLERNRDMMSFRFPWAERFDAFPGLSCFFDDDEFMLRPELSQDLSGGSTGAQTRRLRQNGNAACACPRWSA